MNSPADTTNVNRQRRSDETLARLCAAATELIAEVGWDNTSSRRVAERAEVSLGVVHYHFASIEALRRYAAVRVAETFFNGIVQTALGEAGRAISRSAGGQAPPNDDHDRDTEASAGSAADAIRRIFAVLGAGDAHRPELSVLFQSLVAAGRDEELRIAVAAMLSDYRILVEAWLGDFGVAHPKEVAYTIIATVDGYLLQRALDPSLDAAVIAEGLVTLVAQPGEAPAQPAS